MSASAGGLRRRKRELRRRAGELVLPELPEGEERHRAVRARLGGLLGDLRPAWVALYAALSREVELGELIEDLWGAGVRTAFPRIEGERLELRAVWRIGQLQPGTLGILEPARDQPQRAPAEIDVFAVPGLLFDRAGRRLGRGRGYYDRLLALARPDAPRVGVCFAEQLIDRVPVEPWDQGMSDVVTDRERICVAGAPVPARERERPCR